MFFECLQEINSSYYETVYESLENFRYVLSRRGIFTDDGDFIRYGERIFCYELYHQLRMKLDEEIKEKPDFLQGAVLQGELKKCHIDGLAKHLNLVDLNAEYTPDFIIHTPSSDFYHAYIIEVKCLWDERNENISITNVWEDLDKINQFISRFNYKRGIFLAINTNPDYLKHILERLSEGYEISNEIKKLKDLDEIEKVNIICKPRYYNPTLYWDWEQNNWVEE